LAGKLSGYGDGMPNASIKDEKVYKELRKDGA
jgi:hypothetical protein